METNNNTSLGVLTAIFAAFVSVSLILAAFMLFFMEYDVLQSIVNGFLEMTVAATVCTLIVGPAAIVIYLVGREEGK